MLEKRPIIDDFDEEEIEVSDDPFYKFLSRSDEKKIKKIRKTPKEERE